jgi:ribonuclease HI
VLITPSLGVPNWSVIYINTAPSPRHVKLNVDASFHEDRHAGAAGAVLRDFEGNFIDASCVFIPHVTTPSMAEAIVMREGLELANNMSYNRVQAESDSTR